jgi:hypothetical protein
MFNEKLCKNVCHLSPTRTAISNVVISRDPVNFALGLTLTDELCMGEKKELHRNLSSKDIIELPIFT